MRKEGLVTDMRKMKKGWTKRFSMLVVSLTLIFGGLANDDIKSFASSGLTTPVFPHVKRVSDTSLEITWDKVKDASGYEIYRYDSLKKKYVKVETINKAAATKWRNTKLKTGKTYSYKVRAWRKASGANGKGSKENSGLNISGAEELIKKVLNIYSDDYIVIMADKDIIEVKIIVGITELSIYYLIQNALTDDGSTDVQNGVKIAEHWFLDMYTQV